MLIHVITEKGRGYLPAETAADKMHGVVKFDPRTGKQLKAPPAKAGSYTNYFADSLVAEAQRDSRIIAVHAAMAGGTGESALWSTCFAAVAAWLQAWLEGERGGAQARQLGICSHRRRSCPAAALSAAAHAAWL